jgi:hypothetical protein
METAMDNDVVRVGVTGHIRLTRGSARPIYRALKALLRGQLLLHDQVHGVTCLADGADRLFARAIRDVAGTFDVVLPGPPDETRQTRRLLRQARRVTQMPADPRPEIRYAAASEMMLRNCDLLVAVWDGHEDGTYGGTAYTVARAREQGTPVRVVWPEKARRLRGYVGGGSMSHSSLSPVVAVRTSE